MPVKKQRRKAKRAGRKVRPSRLKQHRKHHRKHRQRISHLCDTLAEIAIRITDHYRNKDGTTRLQYDVSRFTVSDFKRGMRLDGAPPPPTKVNSRQYDSRQWIEWFEKNMFPKWKLQSNGHGGTDNQLWLLKQQDEREALLQKKFLREKERGLFISIDEHNRIALEMGLLINRALTEQGETQLSRPMLARIDLLNISEDQRRLIIETIKDAVPTAVNGLREAVKKQVMESQVKAEGAT